MCAENGRIRGGLKIAAPARALCCQAEPERNTKGRMPWAKR
jgi:hypothetical protein